MKFLFFLSIFFSMHSAYAYLYSDFSRISSSEIECLETFPSQLKCERLQNNLMMCRSEFEALMKNAGIRTLNLTHYQKISVDNKFIRPLTDGINEFTAKFEAKSWVKKRVTDIKKISKCE